MNDMSMTELHDPGDAAPWQWRLPARAASRLRAAPGRRWLAVQQGRVWLTRSQRVLEPGEDVWLRAGERHLLPPGSEWVVEGWPEARVLLLEAPQC